MNSLRRALLLSGSLFAALFLLTTCADQAYISSGHLAETPEFEFPFEETGAPIDPDLQKGHTEWFKGHHENAIEAYQTAISKSSTNIVALMNAALVSRDAGKPKVAHQFLHLATEIEPQDFEIQKQMGWVHISLGQWRAAVRYFSQATQTKPGDWESHFGLGWAHKGLKDFPAAETSLKKTIELHPHAAAAYYLLGQVQTDLDQIHDATQAYEKALKKDYNLLEGNLPQARLHEKQHETESARKLYRKILQVDGKNKTVRNALARLPKPKSSRIKGISAENGSKWDPKKTSVKKRTRKIPPPISTYSKSVRIGISVDGRGRPISRKNVAFHVSGAFVIKDLKSKKVLFEGKAWERWLIEKNAKRKKYKPHLHIFSPHRKKPHDHYGALLIEPIYSTATIMVKNIVYGKGFSWGGKNQRGYRGKLEIHRYSRGVRMINQLAIEDYLLAVVPAEMISTWPLEALKAQAVAARSDAYFFGFSRRRHRKYDYDLCDDQHCQVYRGVLSERSKTRRAVEETAGEVITYKGKVAHAIYSSNCGGHTQASREVPKWGHVPYWLSVKDAPKNIRPPRSPLEMEKWLRGIPPIYCAPSQHTYAAESRWIRIISAKELTKRLNRYYPGLGKVKRIIPLKRSTSGNVNLVKIVGTRKTVKVNREHQIRRRLAVGNLRSTLFTLETHYNLQGTPTEFVFWGGGWGHGVGMCQSGAATMADRGRSYNEILTHYFKGINVAKIEEL